MPCGHSQVEFEQFSKTERRILHMIFDLHYERDEIKAALEIADPTFRCHIAKIKRKQAMFRKARAEQQIKQEQERLGAAYVPGAAPEEEEDTVYNRTGPNGNSVRRTPHNLTPLKQLVSLSSVAPISRPLSIPPVATVRTSPYTEISHIGISTEFVEKPTHKSFSGFQKV